MGTGGARDVLDVVVCAKMIGSHEQREIIGAWPFLFFSPVPESYTSVIDDSLFFNLRQEYGVLSLI